MIFCLKTFQNSSFLHLYRTLDLKPILEMFQVASLGNGGDHILDAVSHCEQIHQEMEGIEGSAPWRLFLRKELFCPWESAVLDPVATGLVFAQVQKDLTDSVS